MTRKELDYLAEKVADAIVHKMFNSDEFEVSALPSATDEQMIVAEIARLMTLMSQYEDTEEYEKAAIIKNKISNNRIQQIATISTKKRLGFNVANQIDYYSFSFEDFVGENDIKFENIPALCKKFNVKKNLINPIYLS